MRRRTTVDGLRTCTSRTTDTSMAIPERYPAKVLRAVYPERPQVRPTTSYEPGDVLVFHCLTPHAALPNRGSTLLACRDPAGDPAARPQAGQPPRR